MSRALIKNALLTTVLTVTALANVTPVHAQTPPPAVQVQPISANAVAAHYAALVHANYADTLSAAKTLQAAVHAFTAQPSVQTLAEARKTWLAAREFYGQTEAFRFYGGPIDDDNGPEGQLNAWPMDESYVDSVEGKPNAGLINNRKFVINPKNLMAQNERGGEENVSGGSQIHHRSLKGCVPARGRRSALHGRAAAEVARGVRGFARRSPRRSRRTGQNGGIGGVQHSVPRNRTIWPRLMRIKLVHSEE